MRFGFGATTATPATGGLFGNTQQAGSSLFPQQTMQGGLFNNPAGGFGAQATGTAHVKYSPLVGIDVVYKRGASPSVNIKHHCITCMKEYENKSLEELRLEDYTAGRKGAAGGVLGFSQPEAKPMFGATSTFGAPATTSAPSVFGTPSLGAAPFGQTSGFGAQATGTAHVKYSPLVGIDVVYKRGASQSVNIKHHCITCMKEYENKSLEELRLEDYTAGRKGAAGGVLGFSQPEAKPMFWATSTFGAPATTSAPSVFGTPSLGAAPRWPRKAQRRVISTSLFGAPASTQASTLGTNTASFGFGSNLQTQVRGPEVSVSMSRGNPATTGFGAVGGLLDNKPMQSAPTTFGAQPGTSLFGAPASTQASTLGTNTASFGFGSNLQTQNTSDMFGAKAATTGFGAVGGLLGNKPAQSAPTTFGAQPAVGSMAGGFGTATSSSGLLGGADFGKPALVLSASASALASRTSCTGGTPNNLPPLGFHSIHGKNVRISRDGSTARHVESFCKGVAISARPVRVNEKVCIRFVEISNSRSFGVICFGFTTHDPATLAYSLPKNEWIDQANKPGIWAEALGERFCEKDNVLYFYVNYAGDVHFGVNGEEKGLFFSGVDTRNPLWALVGIYGKYTAVQFADPRVPTQVRVANHSPVEDERLVSSLRSLSVEEPLPAPRYQNPLVPLSLHQTKGRNVQFVNDRGVAARSITELCQGYVFTARPMCPGQTIVIQILATEAAYAGSLAIGLTSCNPWFLRVCDLPEDAELLLDRPEYWVVKRDAANGLRRGDELAVTLTLDGQVRVSRNGSNPVTVMHVDHTLRLWAFVDIYGATQKVRMLSSQLAQSPQQVRVQGAPLAAGAGGTELVVSLPPQGAGQNAANQMTLASAHYIEPIQSSQLCLSTVPMTNQPTCSVPPYPRPCSSREGQCLSSQNSQNEQVRDTPNGDCRELRAGSGHDKLPIPAPSTSRQIPHQSIYSVIGDGNLTGTECTICYENPIDSVLYMCGHMCMCYRCAVQQWTGKGSGKCPLCRAQIKDVIRTYKS